MEIGMIFELLCLIAAIFSIGKILGSRMGIGTKLVLVSLVIGVTVGIYQLTEGIPMKRQRAYSEAFQKAFAELVEERGELPLVSLSGDEKLTDAKMVYCGHLVVSSRWDFTGEHIPKKNRASSPEETDVIIVVIDGSEVYGQYRYESGLTADARRMFCIVTAIDVRNNARLAEKKIYGDPPAKEISSGEGTWGLHPTDKDIERYIISFINGSTYEDRQKDVIEVPAEEPPH